MSGERVRLRCNLTDYDSRLVAGSLGRLTDREGMYGVIVHYDCGARLDTLMRSLEIVDAKCPADEAGYLQWKQKRWSKATRAVMHVGPAGGFKYLRYKIGKHDVDVYDSWFAAQELDGLLAAGRTVKEIRPDGSVSKPHEIRSNVLRAALERQAKKQQDAPAVEV